MLRSIATIRQGNAVATMPPATGFAKSHFISLDCEGDYGSNT
jgi:hypothetical protein